MKAHKYRIYPNEEQKQMFAMHFGHTRHVFNWALAVKKQAYEENKKNLSKRDIQDKMVLSKKEEKPWLNEVNSQSLLFALDCLDKAYKRFFKKQSAFPKFKTKHAKQSFSCPQHCMVDRERKLLTLPKIKNIRIELHRDLPEFKTVTISKTPTGKYYASFIIDEIIINTTPDKKIITPLENIIGIDLGICDFIITSHGEKINNLRLLDKSLPKLAKWQKIHARLKYTLEDINYDTKLIKRKKIYSKNKEKSKLKIALLHEKIANQRRDYLHKVSHHLARENQASYIAMEDLNISGMMKNKKLARHIANASWYTFKTLLSYKLEWENKKLITINQWLPSSKTCSHCEHKLEKLPLAVRHWHCPQCHASHDRDINAAKNIAKFAQIQLAEGLGLSLAVKRSSTSIPSSVGDVAKGAPFIHKMHGSQEAPPRVLQSTALQNLGGE